jgi:hypothetical protein
VQCYYVERALEKSRRHAENLRRFRKEAEELIRP